MLAYFYEHRKTTSNKNHNIHAYNINKIISFLKIMSFIQKA